MTMLEELAENRGLQQLVQEVEKMLSEMKLEKLPSFEIGMERGIKKGMAKAMANVEERELAAEKKGEQKGERKGEEKGERKAKLASAKAMLAKGFEISLIHEITGLSPEEITQLTREA